MKLFSRLSRTLWLSQWFSLAVGIAIGIAWLAVDSSILHIDKNVTGKLVSTLLSALVAGVVTLLIQVYGRLDRWLEMFTTLEKSVTKVSSLENRLLPSLYVSPGMKDFHGALLDWRREIESEKGHQASPLEMSSWQFLADAYFRGEQEAFRDRIFETTSDQYTYLVNQISQTMLATLNPQRKNAGGSSQLRVQITGMLPEEFYNAPQIEYTTEDSQPVFFCHRWEQYSTFYSPAYRHDPDIQIQRYIVVRDPNFQRSRLSALSTFNDLLDQTSLVVQGRHDRSLENDISNEPCEVLERLLRRVSEISSRGAPVSKEYLLEKIRSIHGHEHYGYWPIARHRSGGRHPYNRLLDFFVSDYHGALVDDARYCVIDENSWAICDRTKLLRNCFVPGWTPEIALFGNQDPERPSQPMWHVGILGVWRPFTRDMRLRFLTAEDTSNLFQAFTVAAAQCEKQGGLLSLP